MISKFKVWLLSLSMKEFAVFIICLVSGLLTIIVPISVLIASKFLSNFDDEFDEWIEDDLGV